MASREQALAEFYEAAAGPLSWSTSDVAVGECGGRRVRLEPYPPNIGGGNRVLRGAQVYVDLGGRVITTEIHNRKRTSFALPEVLTGDPEFDDLFVVYGWPETTIREALDHETRRWFQEEWPNGFPPVSVQGRELVGIIRLLESAATPRISEDEFRHEVAQLASFGTRLIEAYDEEKAEEARFGVDGGSAWEENLTALEAKRVQTRKTVRLAVFGGLALLVAVIFAAVVFSCGP